MRYGVFIPMEPAGRDPAGHYQETLDLIVAAEGLGYSSVWLASRHLSPGYAAVPSPLLLLAAAGPKTHRIRLGTAVLSLPLEEPVRVSEDISTLDALTRGRAVVGVGSGDDPPAFEAMGVDFEDRKGVTSERLIRLLEILKSGKVGLLPLHPEPLADIGSRIFLGVQSAGGAAWAATQGIGIMLGRSEPGVDDVTASQALSAKSYRQHNQKGEVVVLRNVWLGSLHDPSLAEALARYDTYLRTRGRAPLPEGLEAAAEKMNIVSGGPGQVVENLRREMRSIEPDEVAVTVDPGGAPPGEAEKRLSILAEALGLRP